ncbi:MAG TPA: hypothetical protein VGN52_13430 [Burkholderiales bacterium]|jgi:hypothetical protein
MFAHFAARAGLLVFYTALFFLLLAAALLAYIYPYHPRGWLGWGLFLLLGAPLAVGLETIGVHALQNRVVRKLSRGGRIAWGVVIILALAALMLPVWQWARPYMDTW